MLEQLLGFINDEILRERGVRVGPDDELLLDGYLDSMAVFSLVNFIEGQLGVPVPAQDITVDNFRTAGIISHYLGRH